MVISSAISSGAFESEFFCSFGVKACLNGRRIGGAVSDAGEIRSEEIEAEEIEPEKMRARTGALRFKAFAFTTVYEARLQTCRIADQPHHIIFRNIKMEERVSA